MEIRMSDDGKKAFAIKAAIIATIILALFIFLIYPVLRALTIVESLIEGIENSVAAIILLIFALFIAVSVAWIYGSAVQRMTTAILNERELTIEHGGAIHRLPYSEIKAVHTFQSFPSVLAFVDSFFALNNIAIEAPRNFYIFAVKDAQAIIGEINKRIVEAHRPKGPTIEDLMREIAELKEEIKRLKAEGERERERRPTRRREFEVGPIEEEM